jgi:hypothetical protein
MDAVAVEAAFSLACTPRKQLAAARSPRTAAVVDCSTRSVAAVEPSAQARLLLNVHRLQLLLATPVAIQVVVA